MSILKTDGITIEQESFQGLLENNGIDISNKKIITDSDESIKYRLENILGKSPFSELLMMLYHYGIIKLDDNFGKSFFKENETKILEVNTKEIIGDLIDDWGADEMFRGEVKDIYFDTKNKFINKGEFNNGKKASFRIRFKKKNGEEFGKYYCTIKRRSTEYSKKDLLRGCYEEEFLIPDIMLFQEALSEIGLLKDRLKVKERVALTMNGNIGFDFDDYKLFPPILEIEAKNQQIAMHYIKKLGLSDYKTLNGGSRKLFKYYGKKMKTFH